MEIANIETNARVVMTADDIRSIASALEYQCWNDRELTNEESQRIKTLIETINLVTVTN